VKLRNASGVGLADDISGMAFLNVERPPESVTALLGEPGHRWLTAQGPYDGNSANLTVYLTEGGVFVSAEPVSDMGFAVKPLLNRKHQMFFCSCGRVFPLPIC